MHLGLERGGRPGGGRAGRDHIGMAGETQVGRGRAAPGVEVFYALEIHPAAVEAEAGQQGLDQVHGPGVDRGYRRSADQVAGQVDGIDQGRGCVTHGPML